MVKPHGLGGEVVVELWSNRSERLQPGSVLTVEDGTIEVRSSRPHQGRYLVRLVGVEDRSTAEGLRGQVLRAAPLSDPQALWVHELMGAQVVTLQGRTLGTVEAVEANPAADLLVVQGGVLVPLNFVVEVATGADGRRQVTVDLPAGLVE